MCEQLNPCPHPAVKECSRCRIGLCSAHLNECDHCQQVFCRECSQEHRGRSGKGMQRVTVPELVKVFQKARMA